MYAIRSYYVDEVADVATVHRRHLEIEKNGLGLEVSEHSRQRDEVGQRQYVVLKMFWGIISQSLFFNRL